ncbi:midkine-B-like, partial [Clarias magur]
MRGIFSVTIILLVALTIAAEAVKTKEKVKEVKTEPDCDEWMYGRCVPNSGDCGVGVREATCNEHTKKHKCKVPCNWKKDFG